MKNILNLLLKIKSFMIAKPIVAVAIGTTIIATPIAGVITYNYIQEQNQKEIVYEDEIKKEDLENKKRELKDQLKKENSDLTDDELDKLVEENLKKEEEKKDEEIVKNDDSKKESTSNNSNKNEEKSSIQNPNNTEQKPSTQNPNKPEQKPQETETKPEPQKPETKPEEPIIQPEESTKPSGIDWGLSSEYFSAVSSSNSNDPILPINEWNSTVDNIFLNGGSANEVVQALNSYRYKGKEVFYNYGLGIGVGAKRESLGKNPTLDKVYSITSTIAQHSNYVYLKVYYDSNSKEYILFYVNGTCNVDPFVFG